MHKYTKELIEAYAEKWGIEPDAVKSVYIFTHISPQAYGRFARSKKLLENIGVVVTARQIEYFYHKMRMYERYKVDSKGKPANWSEILKGL